jgi:hypothetical protein
MRPYARGGDPFFDSVDGMLAGTGTGIIVVWNK